VRLRLDAAGKPSFVRWVVSDLPFDGGWIGPDQLGDYFSARAVANTMRSIMLPAPYPILRSPNEGYVLRHEDLLGLARGGVYLAPAVTRRAVRSYRTFSPFPVPGRTWPSGVYFLWHFPSFPAASGCWCWNGWGLPTAVFFRARTFLPWMRFIHEQPPCCILSGVYGWNCVQDRGFLCMMG